MLRLRISALQKTLVILLPAFGIVGELQSLIEENFTRGNCPPPASISKKDGVVRVTDFIAVVINYAISLSACQVVRKGSGRPTP